MLFAKIENNTVVAEVQLPQNIKMPDGSTVTNAKAADITVLKEAGYLPLTDVTPALADYETRGAPVYDIQPLAVTVTYSITAMPVSMYRQSKISKVYSKAKQILDTQAAGYSQVEIATWPAVQADILAYNADNNVVGVALQQAANSSAYTVAELAVMLTPRIAVQAATLVNRKALVEAINAATTQVAIADIDTTAGW